MTRTNLKILMDTKGISITRLANSLNVSTVCIYDVMKGGTTSRRIEKALEELFNLPIDIIRKAWNTQGRPVMTPEIKAALDSFKLAVNA